MNSPIDQLRRGYPDLTRSYFDFLERNAGIEGELSTPPGWVQVWSAEFAVTGSAEYGLPEFLPGYFAFASNGGGELFVVPDIGDDPAVFMVPAGDLSVETIVRVAENLGAFESAIARRA